MLLQCQPRSLKLTAWTVDRRDATHEYFIQSVYILAHMAANKEAAASSQVSKHQSKHPILLFWLQDVNIWWSRLSWSFVKTFPSSVDLASGAIQKYPNFCLYVVYCKATRGRGAVTRVTTKHHPPRKGENKRYKIRPHVKCTWSITKV